MKIVKRSVVLVPAFFVAALLPFICTSCLTTAMVMDKSIEAVSLPQSNDRVNMEFIGFKASNEFKDTDIVKTLGSKLQVAGIAEDRSFAYFGIYSLQELDVYRSARRYVTFVDVEKYSLGWSLNATTNYVGAALVGLVVTLPIGLPMMIGATPKTTYTLEAACNIYAYDTQEHSIKYKDVVTISQSDVYSGNPTMDEWPKIQQYYTTLVANGIIEKYANIKTYLAQWER